MAKDDGWVDPVTVEVRLLGHGSGWDSYPADDWMSPRLPPLAPFNIGPSHSSSGRFGLTIGDIYSSSSSSEGELSDADEAPEEIPIARGPSLLERLSEPVDLPPVRSTLAKFLPSYNHEASPSPELGDFSVARMLHDYARDHSPFIVGAYPTSEDDREDVGRASTAFYTPGMLSPKVDEPMSTIGERQTEEEEESMDMGSELDAEPAPTKLAVDEPTEAPRDVVQIDVAPVVEEPVGNVRVDALEARLAVLDDAIVNLRVSHVCICVGISSPLIFRETHCAIILRLARRMRRISPRWMR